MNGKIKNIFALGLLIILIISNLNANQKAELVPQDFIGENVLHDAIRANDFQTVKYLIKQGININEEDEYEYTALHLAVRLHHEDIASYLVDNNASVNTVDAYEDTPLIDATRNNDTNISKLLICNGANRNIEDAHGMTALQNTAKSKNKEILNLLRADNLEPYCQKEIEISINPFKTLENNNYDKNICGKIIQGFITEIDVQFTDKNDNNFGPYKAEVNNSAKEWCLNTQETDLKTNIYEVEATAKDYVVNTHSVTRTDYFYQEKLKTLTMQNSSNLKININPASTIRGKKPKICGTIIQGEAIQGNVSIINEEKQNVGTYVFKIDQINQKWCAKVTNELENGTYTAEAYATGHNGSNAYDSKEFKLYIIPNLYTALMNEFEDDMEEWDAHLDENTLVFSFSDANGLYNVGSSNLKKKFINIIDNFLPRYVKITSQYQQYIENIIIEGHSSSENALGKNEDEKFKFNKILSEERAQKVLDHTSKIINQEIGNNILWILKTFKSNGLSSTELIYDENGNEDKKQSRRIEFRIINDYTNIKNDGE